MLNRAPVIVCRFLPNGRCQGCGALNVRVNEKTLTCFPCTGQIVTIEDRRRKMYGTMRERFLDLGAELKAKVAEFGKPVETVKKV